jgi:hypothetical protein
MRPSRRRIAAHGEPGPPTRRMVGLMAATVTGKVRGKPVKATVSGPNPVSGDTDLVATAAALVDAKVRVYLWRYGGGPASFADELIACVTLAEVCDEGTAIIDSDVWDDEELPEGAVH